MNKRLTYIFSCLLLAVVIYSCSTEKNTPINRTYHGINAHYNGYFNANELINQSMKSYVDNKQENYFELLVIDPVPLESEIESYYPALDTAIAKCRKVIKDHSMPSNDRPSKKKEEHNQWIDENWITIGIANYYRRDYEAAMKSFRFVKNFYSNDPSLFVGELWMAKTNLQQGKLTEAKFNLDNLDKAIADEQERKKNPEKKTKSKSKAQKSKEPEKIAKFPKKIRFDFEKTKAELALRRDEKDEAIKYLEESLNYAKGSDESGRVHFVLGQLYEEKNDRANAYKHYRAARKSNVPYEMAFNARLKEAFMNDGEDVNKILAKMLRDAKNAPYKGQIYFTMAELAMKENNEAKAFEYFTESAFYANSNPRQKGMAYERMAEISYGHKNYVQAQKYYDSCATTVTGTAYPNEELVKNRAIQLEGLVRAVEVATYEDSVQRIAAMSESDRENFLKGVIKKIQEEEKLRKEREAERLRELQANQSLFVQNDDGGNKWYWNNSRTVAEGYNEFQRLWGERKDEDHWRRSDKTIIPDITINENDTVAGTDSTIVAVDDTLTVDYLSSKLPLTESALDSSRLRLAKALYDAGVIYKEQLEENKLATTQFENVLDRKYESEYNLLSAFQLYKLYESSDANKAAEQKNYILNNYPNSDYANYLRDPDYFIKKKEREALAEQEFITVLNRFNRELYYPVITKANLVIENEKDNAFRSKYMLLKAMSMGFLDDDKEEMVPVLTQVLDEYPNTPEATRAQELIDLIKNGYSERISIEFGSEFIYEYEDKAKHVVFVMLDEGDQSSLAKNRIADFNREFFRLDGVTVSSKLYNGNQSIIVMEMFDTEEKAREYIRKYKSTRKYLLDLQDNKIMMITTKNLRKLFETKDLEQYESFYDAYY